MSPPTPRPLPSREAWERPLAESSPRVRVSLRAERTPAEGVVPQTFEWDDLLDGEPPHEGPRTPPSFCVPGPDVFEGGLRIEMALLVQAVPEGVPLLEDRLCVTGRVLASAIDAERARVGAFVNKASTRSHRFRQRAAARARRMRRHGGPAAIVGAMLAWLSRLLHRVANGALRAMRAITRGVIAFPDWVRAGGSRATAFLATPSGRRRFWEGVKNPRNLPPQQKAVTLFVALGVLTAGLVLVHALVTLILPQHAVAWRRVFLLFVYSFVTSMGPPFPLEPALLAAVVYVGKLPTLATVLAAKVLAAWMVFFVGDEIHDKLQELSARKPWFNKFLAKSEEFARRWGIATMAAFIATPGLPDVVALYIFGTLHMKLTHYLAGVFIGALILNSIVLWGVAALFGL